ncbi:aromatic ring-hydroxylating oxygenase subunit alpha [Gloeothece verrucosa]|uniref:Rieske (2Fe-2S) iron-sulfur domain protein n=1 Tax=Gloeothece verrucosa (strain PCC 7822) TaxID=497965 RepID=E0U5M3_GLOV7|nr:aromatic ring-hydroxylating dioxygenase subunit alpha [Gloeothece verrucosa]ADN14736.1 Rieske (2Fe-2S) iron-sulfur domain protein [Gloeothece verrucosa PCC 7822]
MNMGLPGYYYYDPKIFELEMKTIWCNSWQWVARVSDLPKKGDYLTYEAGEQSIIVINQGNGQLIAMHNVCPHRGASLVQGKGNCHQLVCPYHAWVYNLEGQLKNIPQANLFEDLDFSTIQIQPVQLDTWGGFIFVNLANSSESLSDYLAGFSDYLKQYNHPWEDLIEVARWSYTEAINWKFIVENYVEDYHFNTLHPKSLDLFDFKNVYTTTSGRHCLIEVPYTQEEFADLKLSLPWEPQNFSYQGYIFPNLMVNTDNHHVSLWRVVPISPISTRLEIIIYQTKMQLSNSFRASEKWKIIFDQVLQEDFAICRNLQKNAHSMAYQVSHLARMRELGIAHFYKVLSEFLVISY